MPALIVLLIVLAVIAVPILILARRLRAGETETGGSSWGHQFLGRGDDDWGPKSPPAPSADDRSAHT
jgi:hypothetical protein